MKEACVSSIQQALIAAERGADRIEFCRALDVGGLTPYDSDLEKIKSIKKPVNVIIRLSNTFNPSDEEF